MARELGSTLGMPYWTRDWTEMNRNLFSAIQLEKTAMFVILTLIIFVAAFAIISHLILMVAEKRREIGVLRTLGASGRSIMLDLHGRGRADRRWSGPWWARSSASRSGSSRTGTTS